MPTTLTAARVADLENRVARGLTHALAPGDALTLALSGGRDSVVLFDLLVRLRERLPFAFTCIHVHHGLSPNADAWADFCTRLCREQGVALAVERVVVERADARGVEAAARAARLAVFARQSGWVATAHHRDDQAETLLLQLLRGAGPHGLAAMPTAQALGAARLLRPLLDTPRAVIVDYAQAQGLAWIDDESNQDQRYRRNALRHTILPAITRHFPQADAILARAASLQAEAATLHDELAELDAAGRIDGARLDCAGLTALSPARARNLLRWFIHRRGGRRPQQAQLAEALVQLANPRADARIALHLGDGTLARYRGGGYWLPALPGWDGELAGQRVLDAAGEWVELGDSGVAVCALPCAGGGLATSALARATLRFRRGGERLQREPGGMHSSLKTLLQDAAIPPWQRERMPLVWVDDTLAWAAGVGENAAYRATADAPGWRLAWRDVRLDGQADSPYRLVVR